MPLNMFLSLTKFTNHLTKISLGLAFLLLALFAGCSSTSEEDLARLEAETKALAQELALARHEAAILDRALTNAYRERDHLVDLLEDKKEPATTTAETAAETPMGNSNSGASAQNQKKSKTYNTQRGDTLSTIAQRHGTTIQVLLSLNPYLNHRQNNMVWEHDIIVLP